MDSRNKKLAIDALVEKYHIDLSKSYAYGDTAGDFSMLKSVANPVAINPTRELITKLKEDPDTCVKAQIIVERKDMIYSLKPADIQL